MLTKEGGQRIIGVGLIGYGFGGSTFHAPIIRNVEGLELRAIVERSGDLARRQYPSATIFRSSEELLNDDRIQLVVISTPNPTHFPMAHAVLTAGKHMVMDKPMTVSSSESVRLKELAVRNHLVLSPFHNRRWDGDYKTVKRLMNDGVLGEVTRFESYFDRFRPQLKPGAWRERSDPGSGLTYDLGPHLLDQAFTLFGHPDTLTASIRCERENAQVDDAFDIALAYPRLQVIVGASLLKETPRPRFEVTGLRAQFVKAGFDPQEAALKRGEQPDADAWGADAVDSWGVLRTQEGSVASAAKIETERGDYRDYYRNVRDAINGRAQLDVTADHGIDVVRGIELAFESSRLRSAVPWRV
jgi:scyllo-inositol 2-dehydrogenase (NADP+)